jgi:hypothetical protein
VFTAPDGRLVKASQTFRPAGFVTVLSIDGAPQFNPVRVWKRFSKAASNKRAVPQLFPL